MMGMRVLFTSPSGLGHIHPMVPLAKAMATRGHEVLWATPEDGVGHVERTGIAAVVTGPAGLPGPAEIRRRYPELDALPLIEMPDVMFGKIFGAAAAPQILPDLVRVALEWRPDLVVADAAEFAGHIVAAELGIPSVTKGFGALLPERRVRAAGEEVAPLWRSRGLEPRPYGGSYDHLYLDVYPPEFDPQVAAHVPHRQRLRPVADDGHVATASARPWPDTPADAPLIYVTMGTVFNNPELFQVVVGRAARARRARSRHRRARRRPGRGRSAAATRACRAVRLPGPGAAPLQRGRVPRGVGHGSGDGRSRPPAALPAPGRRSVLERRRRRVRRFRHLADADRRQRRRRA